MEISTTHLKTAALRLATTFGLVLTALTAVSAAGGPAHATTYCTTNMLRIGQVIKDGSSCSRLTSTGGHFTLSVAPQGLSIMQSLTPTGVPTGELTTTTGATWSQSTDGYVAYYGLALDLRADGNLVLVTPSRKLIWSSNTANRGVTRAVMSDNGRLVLVNARGQWIWATDSGIYALGVGDRLPAGQHLVAVQHDSTGGPSTNSNAQRSVGTMQTDGNFVFGCGYPLQQVWQSNTHVPGSYMTMLSNGVLAIKAPGGRTVWSTPTVGAADAFAVLGTRISSRNGWAWNAYNYPRGQNCL